MKYEHQLRKLSSEERKNLSSEELFHSAGVFQLSAKDGGDAVAALRHH